MRNFGLLLFSHPRGIRNAIELAVRYVAEIEIGAVIPKWAVRCGFLDNGLAPSLMPINSRGIQGKHFFSLARAAPGDAQETMLWAVGFRLLA